MHIQASDTLMHNFHSSLLLPVPLAWGTHEDEL